MTRFDTSARLLGSAHQKIANIGNFAPNLKPTSRSISIRLPEYLIDRIKEQANEINVPYQSLIKGYLKKAVLG